MLYPLIYLNKYQKVAENITGIWKEYRTVEYIKNVNDNLILSGTKSSIETINIKENEAIIFGWVVFPSKKIHDLATKKYWPTKE